jgi:hypothetical protein
MRDKTDQAFEFFYRLFSMSDILTVAVLNLVYVVEVARTENL